VKIFDYEYFNGTLDELKAMGRQGFEPGVDPLVRYSRSKSDDVTEPDWRWSGLLSREREVHAFRYDGVSGPWFVHLDSGTWCVHIMPSSYYDVWPMPNSVDCSKESDYGSHNRFRRKYGLIGDDNRVKKTAALRFLVFSDAQRTAQRLADGRCPWTGEPVEDGDQ